MKIKRIGYGCTVNTGSYENKKYYVEADVEDWEDPDETYSALIEWTNKLIKREDQYKDLKRLVGNAESKLSTINYVLRDAEKRWDAIQDSWSKLMAFLKANDLQTEEFERRFPSRPDFSPVGVKPELISKDEREVDEIPFDQSESLENEF